MTRKNNSSFNSREEEHCWTILFDTRDVIYAHRAIGLFWLTYGETDEAP